MRPPILSTTVTDVGDDTGGQQAGGIAERIASTITLGMLAVGERLPTEIELANQFGVAVATLRKALAALRAQGIVETRRGRSGGTFVVKAPYPSEETLHSALVHTSIVALRDLADEHVAISSAAARLAAARTPATAPTRLAELAFRAREAKNGQDRSLADSRFHIEVAVLSHSQRLLTAEQRLQAEYAPLLWSEQVGAASTQPAFSEHLALVMAIEQGREEKAWRIAHDHVMGNVRRIIRAKLELPRTSADAGGDPVNANERIRR